MKYDWKLKNVLKFFSLPFNDLTYKAQTVHRKNFNPNAIQISSLLSIKTGGCPEDCKYCSQSSKYKDSVKSEPMMELENIILQAKKAKEIGASRFCMGAAWRSPSDKNIDKICEIIKAVKSLDLEVCMTLGMVNKEQAEKMKNAGLDYYNHNIDTSEDYYKEIVTTRKYQDRIDTINNVQKIGINVCSGGIVGMGESLEDRAKMLITLANFNPHPQSVPINMIASGTRLEKNSNIDEFDFIKTIAVARIMMPKSFVRLSAGRNKMNQQTQALCFLCGANSIFFGEKMLTTNNCDANSDMNLFKKLGLHAI